MRKILIGMILLAIFSANGCGGGNNLDAKKEDTNKREPTCQLTGSSERFTVSCSEPITLFKAPNIESGPVHGNVILNGIQVNFTDDDKVMHWQDVRAAKGRTSNLDLELTFQSGKKLTLKISGNPSSKDPIETKTSPLPDLTGYKNDGKHYCPGEFTREFDLYITFANIDLKSPFPSEKDKLKKVLKDNLKKCEELVIKYGHLDCLQKFTSEDGKMTEERILVSHFVNERACDRLRAELKKL